MAASSAAEGSGSDAMGKKLLQQEGEQRPPVAGAGMQDEEQGHPDHRHHDDPDYHHATSGDDHASLKSFFLRCLPNRQGSTRSFLWSAFMFILEIPPSFENNIQRKVKKLADRSRPPTREDLVGLAKTYLYKPNVPCLEWGKEYIKRKDLMLGDLVVGLTIAVMLIPQSMAYSVLANLPPVHGMYTACIAPIFYAALGTSRHLQIGPTSLISVYLPIAMSMAGVPTEHFEDPALEAHWAQQRINFAPVLTFWVGVVFLLLSVTRMGNLIKYVSHSVMAGFVSGVALFIGVSQVKHIFGIKLHGEYPYNWELYAYYLSHNAIREGSKITQRMGGLAFLALYGEKFLKRVFPPTAKRMKNPFYKAFKYVSTFTTIIVVVITALVTKGLYARGTEIPIVGSLPAGYAPPIWPAFKDWPASVAFRSAIPLALMGYLEAYSVSRKFSLQFKYPVKPDQELFALGMGNIFGCFFSSYPTSGNFGRTALAAGIGQRTPAANFVVAFVITIVLVSLLPTLYYIPFCTLGAIICAAVITLIDWPEMVKAFFLSKLDCVVMLTTFFTTLFFSISEGLGWGIAASVITLIYKLSHVETVTLGRQPDEKQFVSIAIYPAAEQDEKVKVIRISGRMAFMNANTLRDKLFTLVDPGADAPYKDIIVDCAGVSSIDLTAIICLSDVVLEADKHGMCLYFANCGKQLKSNLTMCGLVERLGGEELCRRTTEEVYEKAKEIRREMDLHPRPRVADDGDGHH